MGIDRKRLEMMRDCVKRAFFKGCARGQEFRKMRHAITVGLKFLDFIPCEIKDLLAEWNGRCERRLTLSELESQLFAYVDWVFKQKEVRLGCRALENYCIGEDKCEYLLRTRRRNKQATQELPFDWRVLDKYLEERFGPDGLVMKCIVDVLRRHQVEKATGDVILIGFRMISALIREQHGHNTYPMDVCRRMRLLIDEGVIEQAVKGKGGMFTYQANGYRFLPWKPPMPTQINSMCNTEIEKDIHMSNSNQG